MPITPKPGPRHLAESTTDTALLETIRRTSGPDLPRRAPRHRAEPTSNAVAALDEQMAAELDAAEQAKRPTGPQSPASVDETPAGGRS